MLRERLLLVTDRKLCGGASGLCARVKAALGGAPRGSVLVQLREKDLDARDLAALTGELHGLCAAAGARLVVNGAAAGVADGVHVPDGGAAPARGFWGVSTHSAAAAVARAGEGADVVLLGPIWETPSKAGYGAPLGVRAIVAAARAWPAGSKAALVAIGGVDRPARALQAVRSGAHAVAVIRAVLAASDPGAAAAALVAAVDEARA